MNHPIFRLWFRIVPFFISSALFLSGFFTIFSPLPLLILGVGEGLGIATVATFTNSAVIYFASGPAFFQFYLIFVATSSLFVPFLLVYRKYGIERTTAITWLAQMLVLVGLLFAYSRLKNHGFFEEIRILIGGFFDMLLGSLTPEARVKMIGEITEAEWRQKTMIELPSNLATLSLVVIWTNLYLLVGFNPKQTLAKMGITRDSFRRWKTSDWFVWPTLLCWFFVLQGDAIVSDVAMAAFKLLMAVYAIQGLAILTTAFDAWRIRGLFRLLAFMVVFFLMGPLLLGVGFFDQWFDFRAKFRQS